MVKQLAVLGQGGIISSHIKDWFGSSFFAHPLLLLGVSSLNVGPEEPSEEHGGTEKFLICKICWPRVRNDVSGSKCGTEKPKTATLIMKEVNSKEDLDANEVLKLGSTEVSLGIANHYEGISVIESHGADFEVFDG